VLFRLHLDPTFEIFPVKFGLILVGDQRPRSRVSSSLAGKLRIFRKASIFRQSKKWMCLKIRTKTKFRELHFRRRSTLHKIGEFYVSDDGRQPQFGQNSILARGKAKKRNWKIINCFFIYMCQTLFTDKKWRKINFGPEVEWTLLAGLPLNTERDEAALPVLPSLTITVAVLTPFLGYSVERANETDAELANALDIA